MNGAFAQTLAPKPWTPGVSPGGGVAPMPPAPAPQPVFTPGVGRRPAIVVGQVEEGQAAVFGDSTGRTLKAGEIKGIEALVAAFASIPGGEPGTLDEVCARISTIISTIQKL